MEIHAFDFEDLKEKLGDIETLDKLDNVGVLCTSNFGGLVLLPNKTGECVFVQDVWDSGYKDIVECEIEYDIPEWSDDNEVESCFVYEDYKYFLSEFLLKNH